MKLLIFIPARCGSKGLKDKNFKSLNGKPLIYYTLKLAKKLSYAKKNYSIFLSTDSLKYLRYSKKNGMKFDYLRPKGLSKDNSNVIDSLFHGYNWLTKKKKIIF